AELGSRDRAPATAGIRNGWSRSRALRLPPSARIVSGIPLPLTALARPPAPRACESATVRAEAEDRSRRHGTERGLKVRTRGPPHATPARESLQCTPTAIRPKESRP